jgi:indole-3-glycerol phosphate synthase
VLTEPDYFFVSDRYLKEIVQAVSVPVLRKDFVLDSYQIYEGKVLGAQAVLLIVVLLDRPVYPACRYPEAFLSYGSPYRGGCGYCRRCRGADHRYQQPGFAYLPGGSGYHETATACDTLRVLAVSESGIQFPKDLHDLAAYRVNGFLIGESLMRAPNKHAYLQALRTA